MVGSKNRQSVEHFNSYQNKHPKLSDFSKISMPSLTSFGKEGVKSEGTCSDYRWLSQLVRYGCRVWVKATTDIAEWKKSCLFSLQASQPKKPPSNHSYSATNFGSMLTNVRDTGSDMYASSASEIFPGWLDRNTFLSTSLNWSMTFWPLTVLKNWFITKRSCQAAKTSNMMSVFIKSWLMLKIMLNFDCDKISNFGFILTIAWPWWISTN